ncbi:MAG: SBBP repeat-containing protein [Candidatus Methanomethylicaceae archaeon]
MNLKVNNKNIEKVFTIDRGGNPEEIQIKIDGISSLRIDPEDQLELVGDFGTMKMTKPIAYQMVDGKKVMVEAKYRITSKETYGFEVGDYDKSIPLIIDPLPLPQATFLGGNSEDRAYSIALNSNDQVYIVGYTGSADFDVTGGVEYNHGGQGDLDVFVAKLDNDLQTLISVAFIGGNKNDYGTSIAIDEGGGIYIGGYTYSADFPTVQGAFDTTYNGGADGFVVRLSGDLNSLLSSTLIGGSNSDYVNGIALDGLGNIYLTGWTLSIEDSPPSKIQFPKTIGAYDSPSHGEEDIFVAKFNSDLSQLLSSTFFGGSLSDYAYSIAINSGNFDVYITGSTASTNFPTTLGAYRGNHSGNLDVFVSRLDLNLQSLLSSTFIGGSEQDVAKGITISPYGEVYITGYTASRKDLQRIQYPTTFGAYQETHSGNFDAFVSKFNSSLSLLMASTLLGGTDADSANGIVIDWSGNVYVTGWTSSSDFPTIAGAFDSSINGAQDVFLAHLEGSLSTLLASTFIGGVSHDAGQSVAIDSTGMVFVTGYTNSFDFIPFQVDGFNKIYHDSWDGFVYRQRPDLSKVNMLTVLLGGEGNGTVVSSPSGIHCGKCPSWDTNCNQQEYSDCTEEYNREVTVTLTAEPSADSIFEGWTGGCDQIFVNPNRCIVNVIAIKSVTATFKLRTFTITAGTDLYLASGTISPMGSIIVSYGGSQSFTITPDANSYIGDVIVDGISQGSISNYTFTNVISDHSILAVFRRKPVITASATTGGSISPSGSVVVNYNGSMSFSITPDAGYYLTNVVVDGISQGPISSYTFNNVTSDRTIQAIFRANPTVTLSAGGGGTISPEGSVTVNYGGSLFISVKPDSGYFVDNLLIDGESIGPVAGYFLQNITEDHTVEAFFTQEMPQGYYYITATSNEGGTISPYGVVKVRPLKKRVFLIKPQKGYHIKDVIVDGQSKGPLSRYTFNFVSASHTIEAKFDTKKTLHVEVAGSGQGAVISRPSGINCGRDCSQTYNTDDIILLIPKPSSNSVFAGWSGGGCSGTDFSTVRMTGDITVTAIFNLK